MNAHARVIIDADNTMGVTGCDTDDGLALLYLLGNAPHVAIEALCCTYGNSDIDTVHTNTRRLASTLRCQAPVLRGGSCPDEAISEASRYMAASAAENPGEIHVVATGSLTNLKGAAQLDENFFSNIASLTLMGGITEPLFVNETPMDELNFSCDPEAACMVLHTPCSLTIATAQACLPAVFTRERFMRELGASSWLFSECDEWFTCMDGAYGLDGFICWDVVAAAALVQPELFCFETRFVRADAASLKSGYLPTATDYDKERVRVRIPRIKDAEHFRQACFAAWKRAKLTARTIHEV